MSTKNSRFDNLMDNVIFWTALIGVIVVVTMEWMQ
jgi:hypothetical protein